jgi:hypothetical protein
MYYKPVVCKHENHDKASRQDCGSASHHAAKLDYRWQRTSPEGSEHRRGQRAFMEQTGRSESTQGDQKKAAPIKQAKKQSIDPHLKEFIDNVIVPILVKKYQVIDCIEKEVRNRLRAAQAA